MKFYTIFLSLIGVFLLTGDAAAQSQLGAVAVSCTIEDANGGTIPGAVVIITNQATTLTRTATTTDGGQFNFPALKPDTYIVTVEKQGFSRIEQLNNLPYTTLDYANGYGARKEARKALPQKEVSSPNYLQEATVPLSSETHAGEDVAIYVDGAGAYLVRGSIEQNWIFQLMKEAMRLK
jgi:alkaline phosphatase